MADDRDAIVFKYPAGLANGYCTEPSCAIRHEECGLCGPAECQPWQACGYCAPPRELTADTTVTITGFDEGQGGCGCGSAGSAGVLAIAVVVLLGLLRRR